MMTSDASPSTIKKSLLQGADSYLVKSGDNGDLTEIIKDTLRGENKLSSKVTNYLVQNYKGEIAGDTEEENSLFSGREFETLKYSAEGLTSKEIAQKLDISEHTVKNYFRRIHAKLGTRTINGAVGKAFKIGVLS